MRRPHFLKRTLLETLWRHESVSGGVPFPISQGWLIAIQKPQGRPSQTLDAGKKCLKGRMPRHFRDAKVFRPRSFREISVRSGAEAQSFQ